MENLKKKIQSAVDAYSSGELKKAENLSKKLIEANPKVVFLYNLLGLILSGQKKIDQAIKCYEKGIEIDPNFAMLYNNLGLLYFNHKSNGNIKKAENFYKKSIFLDKSIYEPHNNLGMLYSSINKFKESIASYKRAIELNPNHAVAYHNLGTAYVSLGEFEEAKNNFKNAIKLVPDFIYAHRSLSRITKYTIQNDHYDKLKKLYESTNEEQKEGKMYLSFSLGKVYEDIKDFDKSFFYYKKANSIYRSQISFSIEEQKKEFEEIKKKFNNKLFNIYKNNEYLDSSPIFIVGMPRSGTTLIEQILSSHPNVFGADETELIPKLVKKYLTDHKSHSFFTTLEKLNKKDLIKIGKEYDSEIKSISNSAQRTTDKLPTNFLYIGFIKLILPKSKIVHCYRNPKDNCLSIYKTHFTSGKVKFAYQLDEMVEYYNLYQDLMKYWNNLLPNFIFNIKYENLINNPESEIKNLVENCNLNWDNKCLNFHNNKRPIKTASDTQARTKIYKSSINSWKNYERYFSEHFIKLNI